MSLRGAVLTLAKLSLFAIALVNVATLFGETPMVNEDARVAGPSGDWRTQFGDLLYERPAYLKEQAFQNLAKVSETGEARFAEEARAAATESLAEAPADPYSWTLLAWSEMLLANDDAARAALKRSWALAPNSPALAEERIMLAEALGFPERVASDRSARMAMVRDAQRIKDLAPRAWQDIKTQAPRVGSVVEGLQSAL